MSILDTVFQKEDLNFILTNKIPRRLATQFVGWFSQIEQPLIRDASIAVWIRFAGDPHLEEAKKTEFASLHDCFIRELKEGVRPVDRSRGVLVSPCDGVVGPLGAIAGTRLIQAKGSAYALDDLLTDPPLAEPYRGGSFVTLRLTASMYHRFHAPADCDVSEVHYVSGDAFNVNPIALKRVPRLFCRNERVVIPLRLKGADDAITLVAVGAILVAGIHLNFADATLNMRYRGPNRIACSVSLSKADEMGYFRLGSTILVLATPGLALAPDVREGRTIRLGEALFRHRASSAPTATR
jgi:phosphatidylserine decarboxylase